jgi:hypothetical protein
MVQAACSARQGDLLFQHTLRNPARRIVVQVAKSNLRGMTFERFEAALCRSLAKRYQTDAIEVKTGPVTTASISDTAPVPDTKEIFEMIERIATD